MARCPESQNCPFTHAVEPNLLKRVKYASAYPYCRGGSHEACEIRHYLVRGQQPPMTLLPNGEHERYSDTVGDGLLPLSMPRVLVLEEIGIFRQLAANTVRASVASADVIDCESWEQARSLMQQQDFSLIVCGDTYSCGASAHDVRRLSMAPMIVMRSSDDTGWRGPTNTIEVSRSAGPEPMRQAVSQCLGRMN